MHQCYGNIRTFLMDTIEMMIDNLTSFQGGAQKPNQGEAKHIILLKTIYGMVDEMLSKNFLEDKKTNQKNLFERDPNE